MRGRLAADRLRARTGTVRFVQACGLIAGRGATVSAAAAVSTVGSAGFLAGPPITGAFAEAASLRTATLVPLLLMVAMVLLARRLDSGPDGG
ncbi:hypothetical protein [Streptomyces sp. NPDC048411]|uniref:hypothetical protein n=1 Tax=Streptomyces sp. NPDC048411 TaxID=3157206 RepID=UPI0034568D3B